MHSRKFQICLRVVFLIFSSAFAATAHSQMWPVRTMLERINAPVIQLKDKDGSVTDKVNRSWVQRVANVTDRLSSTYGLPAPLLLINKQNGPNAFVTFGKSGPVMVIGTDMLRIVGDDDDLMAAVIGHELGHLKADHLTKGANNEAVVSLIGMFAGLLLDVNQAKQGVNTQGLGMQLGSLGSGLVNAKFTRDQERDADDLGIRNMAAAGFDPNAVSKLWRVMESQGAGGSGLWMSSHPSNEERYQKMQTVALSLGSSYASSKPSTKPLQQFSDSYPAAKYPNFETTLAENQEEPLSAYVRGIRLHREKRYEDAVVPLREAADLGDERALCILGDYAQYGRAQPIDLEKARNYYGASANKGFGYGIFSLGQMFFEGKGITKDLAEAARLITIAHNRNVPRATAYLGLMYSQGSYVEKDLGTARQLVEKSAVSGDLVGRTFYGVALRDGLGGPSDQPRSFALLQLAADTNYPFANYQLGISYERGAGTAVDKEKAIAAYRKAASGGVAAATQRLKVLGF